MRTAEAEASRNVRKSKQRTKKSLAQMSDGLKRKRDDMQAETKVAEGGARSRVVGTNNQAK